MALLNETQRIEMARMLAQRLMLQRSDVSSRMDLLFRLLASRGPSPTEAEAFEGLLQKMLQRYRSNVDDARALLSIGDIARDETLDSAEHAAWTQVALTLLASDLAIILY